MAVRRAARSGEELDRDRVPDLERPCGGAA